MELKDTIKLMTSNSYDDRFIAEYWQVKDRYKKLHKMIIKHEAGVLDFTPKCSIDILKRQAKTMGEYLYILEVRAEIEKVDLNKKPTAYRIDIDLHDGLQYDPLVKDISVNTSKDIILKSN